MAATFPMLALCFGRNGVAQKSARRQGGGSSYFATGGEEGAGGASVTPSYGQREVCEVLSRRKVKLPLIPSLLCDGLRIHCLHPVVALYTAVCNDGVRSVLEYSRGAAVMCLA